MAIQSVRVGGSMSELRENWQAGSTYEGFMGRWSRLLAPRFVSWLGVRSGVHWLEVGCGTGALSEAIRSGADPASLVACDPSESFVDYARRRLVDRRVSFVVAGVGGLPARPGGFDSITSALALNFFPNPEAAIEEMRRVAAEGGLVSMRKGPAWIAEEQLRARSHVERWKNQPSPSGSGELVATWGSATCGISTVPSGTVVAL